MVLSVLMLPVTSVILQVLMRVAILVSMVGLPTTTVFLLVDGW